MARKVRKSRRTALTGLDWLGMPAGLMKDKVKVSPLRASSVVKGPRPGRVGFTRKKSNPVMLGRQRFSAKSSMAGIAAAVAVRKGSKAYIEPLAKNLMSVAIEPKTVHLLGMLLAASALSYGKGLPATVAMGEDFLNSIANTPLDVEVSASGKVTTRVGKGRKVNEGFRGRRSATRGIRIEVGDHVTVTKSRGKTNYHFDSLNFYIQANLIREVNIDSDRVMDFLTDELINLTAAVQHKLVEIEMETDEEETNENSNEQADEEKDEPANEQNENKEIEQEEEGADKKQPESDKQDMNR